MVLSSQINKPKHWVVEIIRNIWKFNRHSNLHAQLLLELPRVPHRNIKLSKTNVYTRRIRSRKVKHCRSMVCICKPSAGYLEYPRRITIAVLPLENSLGQEGASARRRVRGASRANRILESKLGWRHQRQEQWKNGNIEARARYRPIGFLTLLPSAPADSQETPRYRVCAVIILSGFFRIPMWRV